MFPWELVQQVGAFLSVVLLLGGAWMLVRGSYNQAKLHAVDEDNDRLRKRNADLEGDLERCRQSDIHKDEQIRGLKQEVTHLTSLVTQRAEVSEVLKRLEEHNENTIQGIEKIIQEVRIWRNASS